MTTNCPTSRWGCATPNGSTRNQRGGRHTTRSGCGCGAVGTIYTYSATSRSATGGGRRQSPAGGVSAMPNSSTCSEQRRFDRSGRAVLQRRRRPVELATVGRCQ